ncbi:synaptonemal complex protein 1 [Eurytemora carolleeae]|uniref:synaptonemal complex protein 1 n=1 Tax=Eurytemora carolleeae TaxID=1294199 RepID=UPI000C78142B|nr:synaptonemal complex protein 1 [Eurytemora carolleeae]|eukprot:XP_023322847.1 synaptonemal complex protein 1-like [Eurytemora affinis]
MDEKGKSLIALIESVKDPTELKSLKDRLVQYITEFEVIAEEKRSLENYVSSLKSRTISTKNISTSTEHIFENQSENAESNEITPVFQELLSEKETEIQILNEMNGELKVLERKNAEKYENQLEVSRILQKELQASFTENQSLAKEMEKLNFMFAELEQSILNQENNVAHDREVEIRIDNNSQMEPATPETNLYNEVNTKNGPKMVLSVSKTFNKLKDLILEKKSLEEQLSKMKHINLHFCSQVNIHEEKLCNITDELNNTWFYVSKIKEQHRKLHSSEQILRAELAEKRILLSKLRVELEDSKQCWNIVKQKTADSEKQWVALKADLAEQKRLLFSTDSSESGISEAEDVSSEKSEIQSLEIANAVLEPDEVFDESIDNDDNESFSDEEIPNPFSDEEEEEPSVIEPHISIPNLQYPVFFPSVSYIANVPNDFQCPLIPAENEKIPIEENNIEQVDDNVRELITRLSSSTARGAFLANKLAELHKKIAVGEGPLVGAGEEDSTVADDEETGGDEEDNSSEMSSPIPDLDDSMSIPEINTSEFNTNLINSQIEEYHTQGIQEVAETTIDRQLTTRSEAASRASDFDDMSSGNESDDEANSENTESPTDVTRFLIHHLPIQLSKLRNEKSELEEKNMDMEQVISDQKNSIVELERRLNLEKNKNKVSAEKACAPTCKQFAFVMEEIGKVLLWDITSNTEIPPAFWLTYFPPQELASNETVLPSSILRVAATSDKMTTTLRTICFDRGTYTLHIEEKTAGTYAVKLFMEDSKEEERNI